jgi:hypothetical protein
VYSIEGVGSVLGGFPVYHLRALVEQAVLARCNQRLKGSWNAVRNVVDCLETLRPEMSKPAVPDFGIRRRHTRRRLACFSVFLNRGIEDVGAACPLGDS